MKTKFVLLSILLSLVFSSYSQTNQQQKDIGKTIQIKGSVIDSTTQKTIQMVFVTVAGTIIGTLTDSKGSFVVSAPEGAKQLVFSAKGYKAQRVDIDTKNEMKVKLVLKDK